MLLDPAAVSGGRPPTARTLLRACLSATRRDQVRALASGLLRQVAFLALPWLAGRAVQAVADGDPHALAVAVSGIVAAALVEWAGSCGWTSWSAAAAAGLAGPLRTAVLHAVLTADPERLAAVTDDDGDLLARGVDDLEAVLRWVRGLATWVVVATTVVVLVPALAGLDPLLLAVAVACAGSLLAVHLWFPRRHQALAGRAAAAQAARTGVVEQLLSAGPTLRGVGGEHVLVDRHTAASREVTARVLAVGRSESLWGATGAGLPLVAVAVGLGVGGLAVADGRMQVGDLATFTLWMGTVQVASRAVAARLHDLGAARAAAARLAAVLALAPATTPLPVTGTATGSTPAPGHRDPGLELRGVVVQRSGRPLGPLDLHVPTGRWALLEGATGTGKSTLLRAVAGAVPHGGSVRWSGADLGPAGVRERADVVALVPQQSVLVHGTVRDNLLLGAPDGTDDAALLAACRAACAEEVLAALDGGLDAPVHERGASLSGGQRQRLALARALLRPGPVLLLDDVTSGLDAATEATLLARLRAVTADRVVLWAGHRPALRQACDVVVALAGPRAETPEVPRA